MSNTPLYVQASFAQRLSYLDNFKRLNTYKWECRCPICGDSVKRKSKTRGNIYERGGDIFYYCHNCGASMSLAKFIKEINPGMYAEFQVEKMKAEGKPVHQDFDYTAHKSTKRVAPKGWRDYFIPFLKLPQDHPAVRYILSRKIPREQWAHLYYTDNYRDSVIRLGIEDANVPEDARIVFPFLNKSGELTFIQGRSLEPKALIRYVTTKVVDELKLFGLDRVDVTQDIYVTEGPIDSMYTPNGVATADAALERASYLLPKEKLVLVFDNEPRSHIAVAKMKKAIEHGFRVVIFPSTIEWKDLNEMFLRGVDTKLLVVDYAYRGPRALLELQHWKKV